MSMWNMTAREIDNAIANAKCDGPAPTWACAECVEPTDLTNHADWKKDCGSCTARRRHCAFDCEHYHDGLREEGDNDPNHCDKLLIEGFFECPPGCPHYFPAERDGWGEYERIHTELRGYKNNRLLDIDAEYSPLQHEGFFAYEHCFECSGDDRTMLLRSL